MLVALAAGESAAALEGLTDAEAVAGAMAALRSMFPATAPAAPRSYMLSRWGQDPWAMGSLSYYAGVPRRGGRLRRLAAHGREAWGPLCTGVLRGSGADFLCFAGAVGASPGDRATLAEPQSSSLILAGEAASVQYPSTVHGALLSGRDAAYRVLDAAAELPLCGSVSGAGGACVAPPAGAAAAQCECDAMPQLPLD